MERLTAINTLWAFNTTDVNTPPHPNLITNMVPVVVFDERACAGSGDWGASYKYAPGAGTLGARGVRGEIRVWAESRVRLYLNRIGPACASGACVGGEARARFELDFSELVPLTDDLRVFLERRTVEDGLQSWYLDNGQNPETLRRLVGIRSLWCRGSTTGTVGGGVTAWPPGLQYTVSASDNQGEMAIIDAVGRVDRRIEVCLRAPAQGPGVDSTAEFTLRLKAELEADTELAGGAYSRAESRVERKRLEMVFEPGCVECEVDDGPMGPVDQGGKPGIG